MTELQAGFGDIVDSAYDHVFDKKVSVGRFMNRLTNLPIERMEVHREFLEKSWMQLIRTQPWIKFGLNSPHTGIFSTTSSLSKWFASSEIQA